MSISQHRIATWEAGNAAVHVRPARARTGLRAVAAAAVIAVLLAATALLAFEAGRGAAPAAVATPVVPPVVPRPVTVAPVAPPAPAVPEPGPVLVDDDGAPLPSDIATSVRTVYTALDSGDLDPVRAAYSATGSDDWLSTEQDLDSAATRKEVLAALRTTPRAGTSTFTYAAGGTSVRFGWASPGTGAGLQMIDGPWHEVPTASVASVEPVAPVSTDPTWTPPTRCAASTVDAPAEGHPCTDPDTGRGVDYDGTVGVHGLKPCPHGTEIPTDEDEPTRNARTGEICGWDGS